MPVDDALAVAVTAVLIVVIASFGVSWVPGQLFHKPSDFDFAV